MEAGKSVGYWEWGRSVGQCGVPAIVEYRGSRWLTFAVCGSEERARIISR